MTKPVYKVIGKESKSLVISNGKYALTYRKGKVTKAKKSSLGIFCFKTLKQARKYADIRNYANKVADSFITLILKVEPIGRGKVPKLISPIEYWDYTLILDQFYKGTLYYSPEVPEGTICYPAVKVLEIKE